MCSFAWRVGEYGGCQVEEGVREWRRGGCVGGAEQTKMVKWHNKDEQLTVFCRSFRSIVYIQTAAAGSPLISISPSPCLSLSFPLSFALSPFLLDGGDMRSSAQCGVREEGALATKYARATLPLCCENPQMLRQKSHHSLINAVLSFTFLKREKNYYQFMINQIWLSEGLWNLTVKVDEMEYNN